MINKTSSFYKPKEIDFTVMGFDNKVSVFLNWCMENRDNLEFIQQCGTLDKSSQSSVLHADHLKTIKRIDDVVKHERT